MEYLYINNAKITDISFLDTTSPDPGLNTLEQISALRNNAAAENSPVILLSPFSRHNTSLELKRQKYVHQISKPLYVSQLHDAVSQAIKYKSPLSQSYAKLTPANSKEFSLDAELDPVKGFHFLPFILPIRASISLDPNLKILLAEDNMVNQKVTELLLKKMGYEIDVVVNGRLAFEAVANGSYDVVLMDKLMPVMDGIEATRKIRELEGIEQPIVIALTASASMEDEIACRKAEMDNFLAKPVQLEKMKAALGFATSTLAERRMNIDTSAEVPELPVMGGAKFFLPGA